MSYCLAPGDHRQAGVGGPVVQSTGRTPSPAASIRSADVITAMVLPERLAVGYGDDGPFVIGWREELSL
jgi:hypothetical protein